MKTAVVKAQSLTSFVTGLDDALSARLQTACGSAMTYEAEIELAESVLTEAATLTSLTIRRLNQISKHSQYKTLKIVAMQVLITTWIAARVREVDRAFNRLVKNRDNGVPTDHSALARQVFAEYEVKRKFSSAVLTAIESGSRHQAIRILAFDPNLRLRILDEELKTIRRVRAYLESGIIGN